MNFVFNHFNFNVANLEHSLSFYEEAFSLKVLRQKKADDGSFILAFLGDEAGTPFSLELTWMRDRIEPYDLGEQEFHLAFVTDDYDAAHALHQKMDCICFENPGMGIYFVEDPDGYWIEVVPKR